MRMEIIFSSLTNLLILVMTNENHLGPLNSPSYVSCYLSPRHTLH